MGASFDESQFLPTSASIQCFLTWLVATKVFSQIPKDCISHGLLLKLCTHREP